MLLEDYHINEEQNQMQINATLRMTKSTLCILSGLEDELRRLQTFDYLKRLIAIQISDLQNKQKQYYLFLSERNKKIANNVGPQSNEVLQLNISIRLQLKEELFSYGQNIIKNYSNILFQQQFKRDKSNGKKELQYQYRKLLQLKIDKSNFCQNYVFNTNSTVLFTGYDDGKIRVHGFNSNYKLIQTVLDKKFDKELAWMKQSNTLVVGCRDKSIAIWHHWNSYQKLEGHTDTISCLILNRKEDLIISGSYDKTIKFWKNVNSVWQLYQTIDILFKLSCLSLNTSEEKLISCGIKSDIIILELLSNQQWVITQQIPVEKYGRQLSFVNDNQFIFQAQQFLEIYNFQVDEQKFVKVKQIQFICALDYSDGFKFKILQEKNLIVVKHYCNIILIKYNQNWDHYIQQVINLRHYYLWGNITENGQFLVTWNLKNRQHQVWTLKLM